MNADAQAVQDSQYETPRKRRIRSRKMQLMMTPMIDVVFLLLIFFIMATEFKKPEGLMAAELPELDNKPQTVELPRNPIRIKLRGGSSDPNDFDLPTIEVEGVFEESPTNFDELAAKLLYLRTQTEYNDPETPVFLQPSFRVDWLFVAQAYDAVLRAGYRNISFRYFGK